MRWCACRSSIACRAMVCSRCAISTMCAVFCPARGRPRFLICRGCRFISAYVFCFISGSALRPLPARYCSSPLRSLPIFSRRSRSATPWWKTWPATGSWRPRAVTPKSCRPWGWVVGLANAGRIPTRPISPPIARRVMWPAVSVILQNPCVWCCNRAFLRLGHGLSSTRKRPAA
ncbi:hypothetical protein D3C72_819380 [compost metagenome]